MLRKVLRNKYIATVHEGDVREDEVGFAKRYLHESSIDVMDEVIIYPLGENKPYLMRKRGYVVEIDRHIHSAYPHAEQGHVLLSPETMAELELESHDPVLLDPLTPRLDLEKLLRALRKQLRSQ